MKLVSEVSKLPLFFGDFPGQAQWPVKAMASVSHLVHLLQLA